MLIKNPSIIPRAAFSPSLIAFMANLFSDCPIMLPLFRIFVNRNYFQKQKYLMLTTNTEMGQYDSCMGNPKKKAGRPKVEAPTSDVIGVRVTRAESDELRAEADIDGRTVSEHIRRIIQALRIEAKHAGVEVADYATRVLRENRKGK